MNREAYASSQGKNHMYSHLWKFGLVAVLGSLIVPSAIRAEIVTKPGQLVVVDKGNFFSDKGLDRAKEEFARLNSKTGRQAMVETWAELPEAEKARFEKLDKKDTAAVRKFWRDFAV